MGLFARDTNQLLAMKGNMPCPSQAVPEAGQEPKVFIDTPFLIHFKEIQGGKNWWISDSGSK